MQRPRPTPSRDRSRGTMLCCCAIVGLSVVVPLQSSYAQSTPWQSEPGMFCQEDSLGFPSPYSRPDTAHTYRRVFIETQPRMPHAREQVLSPKWTIPGDNRPQGIEPASATPPNEAPVPAPPVEQPVPLPPEADSAATRDFRGSPGRSDSTQFLDTHEFQREETSIPRNADLLDAIFPPTSSTHRLTTPIPLPDYFQQKTQSAQVPSRRNTLVLDHVVGQSALSSRVRNPAHTVAPIPDLDTTFDDIGRGGRSNTSPVMHASGATTSPTANQRVGEQSDAGWLGGKLLGRSFADEPHSVFRAGVEQNQSILDRSPAR